PGQRLLDIGRGPFRFGVDRRIELGMPAAGCLCQGGSYPLMLRCLCMTKITVLPGNIEFEANQGETVMGAAQARGLYWPTTCGGQGICTTCLSEVVGGAQNL